MTKFDSVVSKITESLNWFGLSILLTGMALLVTSDVIMRYVLNSPIRWATDINGILLMIIVFFSLAHCWVEGGHIRMTILYERLGMRGKAVLNVLAAGCGLFFWGLLFYQSLIDISQAKILHETTDDAGILLWPMRGMLSIGLLIFTLSLFMSFIRALTIALRKEQRV